MIESLPIVGVMGSGREPHAARSRPLGAWLAAEGVHLLTGGGGGVMFEVSRAFAQAPERRGLVIGVLPGGAPDGTDGARGRTPPDGYPNPWVEIPIYTHLPFSGARGTDPLSRNHVNVLTSDVIVALPGGAGTASEVALAARHGCPLVGFIEEAREAEGWPESTPHAATLADVIAFVRQHLPVR